MRHPPFRAVSPSPSQLEADAEAPYVAWFSGEAEVLALATATIGLGLAFEGELTRMVASKRDLERLLAELEARAHPAANHLARFLAPEPKWRLRTRSFALDRPIVMGILNLTEDSFSGDGVGTGIDGALRHAETLRDAGADIIDVGAETARADRPVLEAHQEAKLAGEAIAALVREGHCVSADTYKPQVASAALAAGAELINDISGLTLGVECARLAATAGAGYVLNYSYSVPKKRPDAPPSYVEIVEETVAWMVERVARLELAGIGRDQLAIDPGIAFGKSHAEDVRMLRRLGELCSLGLPVLLAHSRKNFIGSLTGRPPGDRDLETHVASVLVFEQGARIFRVHDAAGARRALDFAVDLLLTDTSAFEPGPESWPWREGASTAHMTKANPDKSPPQGQRW